MERWTAEGAEEEEEEEEGTGGCFDRIRRRSHPIRRESRGRRPGGAAPNSLGRKWSSDFHVRETDGGVRHGQQGSQQHQRAPAGEESGHLCGGLSKCNIIGYFVKASGLLTTLLIFFWSGLYSSSNIFHVENKFTRFSLSRTPFQRIRS